MMLFKVDIQDRQIYKQGEWIHGCLGMGEWDWSSMAKGYINEC